MDKQGLIFIPDISGFTKFVNEMEIDHSRHIIQELLEILINANSIGLEISEIEGDAILFYKFGDAPSFEKIYAQVEQMFCEFHRHIGAYEYRKLCQCKACRAAIDLTLKVVTHYGEFTGYNVKNFSKLIGKDIIVAHQLLKNDIDQHEYWLVTESLAHDRAPSGPKEWMTWNASAKKTENGEIPFRYTQLTQLKNELALDPPPQLGIPEQVKVISVSREYDRDINIMFYSAAHFEMRNKWMEGVKSVDEVSHFLPRIGTRYRCVLENGQTMMYTSGFSYHPDKIVYSETDENQKTSTYFTFEKIDEGRTRFTLDYYLKKNPVAQAIFNITGKQKVERNFRRSLENLEAIVKDAQMPVEIE